jgi:hypothetical protein
MLGSIERPNIHHAYTSEAKIRDSCPVPSYIIAEQQKRDGGADFFQNLKTVAPNAPRPPSLGLVTKLRLATSILYANFKRS